MNFFFLLLRMYQHTSSLPTPRPFKRKAGVMAQIIPKLSGLETGVHLRVKKIIYIYIIIYS